MNRLADKETDRQTENIVLGNKADRQTERQTDRQKDGKQ